MSAVRFATICDKCDRASAEYSSWSHCRICGQDACDSCMAEVDPEKNVGTCRDCDADAEQDRADMLRDLQAGK